MNTETTGDTMHCPKCDSTMRAVAAEHGQHVHRCENCHGLFCSEAALNSIQRAWFESPGVKTEKDIDTGHTSTGRYFNERGQITCPSCGTWMDDVTVEDRTHIWFEHCSNCGGAFFDAGELTDLRYKTLADTVRDFVSPKRD